MSLSLKDYLSQIDKNITQQTKQFHEHYQVTKYIEGAIQILIENNFKDEISKLNDIKTRLSLDILINISFLDLSTCLKNLLTRNLEWENKFAIRSSCMTIYEVIKSYDKQQLSIRETYKEFNVSLEDLNEVNGELKEFKKKYDLQKIINIRNKTTGHIDPDFELFYNLVSSIGSIEMIEIIKHFLKILSILDSALKKLREEINSKVNLHMDELKLDTEKLNKELDELNGKYLQC